MGWKFSLKSDKYDPVTTFKICQVNIEAIVMSRTCPGDFTMKYKEIINIIIITNNIIILMILKLNYPCKE